MKQTIAAALSFLLIVLLTACAAQGTANLTAAVLTQAASTTAASSTTATAHPTSAPTATLPPTIAPSPTQKRVTAPTPAPTAASGVESLQECITIEESLPADLELDGALVLSDWMRRVSTYHLDFMSRRRSPFPNAAFDYYGDDEYSALSPDGKWMAYFDLAYNEKGRQKDRILQVANAEGRHLDMSYWTLNWQNLIGWIDNEHLLLAVEDYPGGDYIVLNPFTTEYDVLDLRLKDLVPSLDWFIWYIDLQEAVPDPSLAYWVTAVDKGNYRVWELMQLEGRKTPWTGEYNYSNSPLWSSNGEYFTIMGDFSDPGDQYVDWKLLLVEKDGAAVPLSNPIGESSPKISWSPDSRYLAGWMELYENEGYGDANQLILIDVQKQLFTDLCISAEESWYGGEPPVWSPDGRYFALGIPRNGVVYYYGYAYETLVWDTVIIDVQEREGYILEKDARPQAWMRKR